MDDHAVNISDYYPVLCSLTIIPYIENTNLEYSTTCRIAWDKAVDTGKVIDYSFAVSQHLWTLSQHECDDIETYYNILLKAVSNSTTETLPLVKFRKHLKPYWNDRLTSL